MTLRIIKRDEILWNLFRLERLGDARAANGTNGEPLLVHLNETLLTEGVATIQIARHTVSRIEKLVTRGTVHLNE